VLTLYPFNSSPSCTSIPPSRSHEIEALISLSYSAWRIVQIHRLVHSLNPSGCRYADQTLCAAVRRHHMSAMHLDLSDAEAEALTQELAGIINYARYPLSPRIQTLRAILAKLRPEPVREPLPPPKVYAPPSKGRYRRRRG
jgi:hypothetical protein